MDRRKRIKELKERLNMWHEVLRITDHNFDRVLITEQIMNLQTELENLKEEE